MSTNGSRPRTDGEQSLERALAKAGDGAFAVDAQGRLFLWNRSAERMLGWTAKEVLGRACCEVLRGVDTDGNRLCYQGCHVMNLVKRGEPVRHFEMETLTKANVPIWLDISILEVQGVDGARAMTVHLFRDITAARDLLQLVRERLTPPATSEDGASPLTKREAEILRLLASGANTRALADRLHVSPATVRNHVQNIFSKLEVHSRLEAVAWANRHRLV